MSTPRVALADLASRARGLSALTYLALLGAEFTAAVEGSVPHDERFSWAADALKHDLDDLATQIEGAK